MLQKIGILYHPMKESAVKLAKELEKSLTAKGCSVWIESSWEGESSKTKLNGTDLVLSIGGDGNILRAAQAVLGQFRANGIAAGMSINAGKCCQVILLFSLKIFISR